MPPNCSPRAVLQGNAQQRRPGWGGRPTRAEPNEGRRRKEGPQERKLGSVGGGREGQLVPAAPALGMCHSTRRSVMDATGRRVPAEAGGFWRPSRPGGAVLAAAQAAEVRGTSSPPTHLRREAGPPHCRQPRPVSAHKGSPWNRRASANWWSAERSSVQTHARRSLTSVDSRAASPAVRIARWAAPPRSHASPRLAPPPSLVSGRLDCSSQVSVRRPRPSSQWSVRLVRRWLPDFLSASFPASPQSPRSRRRSCLGLLPQPSVLRLNTLAALCAALLRASCEI